MVRGGMAVAWGDDVRGVEEVAVEDEEGGEAAEAVEVGGGGERGGGGWGVKGEGRRERRRRRGREGRGVGGRVWKGRVRGGEEVRVVAEAEAREEGEEGFSLSKWWWAGLE